MSRYAVLILPFLISAIAIEPLMIGTSGASTIENSATNSINQAQNVELLNQNSPILKDSSKDSEINKPKIIKVLITAYSSAIDETDNSPYITASGSYVHLGTAAANFLPFGTKIRLPKIFGDQIFIIEDRLHENYNDRIDIWLPTKREAINFGKQTTEVEVF